MLTLKRLSNRIFIPQSNFRKMVLGPKSARQGHAFSSTMPSAPNNPDDFKSVQYTVKDKVAHILLNRPEVMNAIDANMPLEIEKAVEFANFDDKVKVILLSGNTVFCSGYDLKKFAEVDRGNHSVNQEMPWDPYLDYKFMSRCTEAFMSLWRSLKPTVCNIKRLAIAGGSDIALCCDVVFMEEEAVIGYPPARVWGCPTTAMWVYRLGVEGAKRMLFTGDLISGKKAAEMGLIGEAVSAEEIDATVDKFIKRIVSVPTNQLFFQKQVINQAVEQMGLSGTQRLATVFDGMTRHSPEGVAFQERVRKLGFKKAVLERDSGEETDWNKTSEL